MSAEKKSLESRSFSFEVRAKSNEKYGDYIEGTPIVYDLKTDIGGMWEEVICRGALDDADLTDVRFLVNHDLNKIPLARSRKNTENSTMQLTITQEGLKIRANLDTENNADARALYSAVKRGDITGMSFIFAIGQERWEEEESDYPKRFIEKISTVIEVSAVTFPAYKATDITARNKKVTLENVRKKPVETSELELYKLKNQILGGF